MTRTAIHIGAYDPAAWAGLVFSDAPGRGFGLRFAVERDGERADGEDLYYLVHEVGPHAPDGSYARVTFRTDLPFGKGDETPLVPVGEAPPGLTLEWSRTGDRRAMVSVTARFEGIVEVRGYFPWDWSGTWTVGRDVQRATSADGCAALVVAIDPPAAAVLDADGDAVLRFAVRPGAVIALRTELVTASADGPLVSAPRAPCAPSAPSVPSRSEAAARYEVTRVLVEGRWADLAAAVTNNVHWTLALQPETGRRYVPAGRRWIFPRAEGGKDHWTAFCWDSFLTALALAVEHPEAARDALVAVLDTQYDSGNVPNWRGCFGGTPDRSQPPVGAFCVLKYFLRTGDRALLEYAFPRLERWSAWWSAPKRGRPRRDGNTNGLFEWGSDLALVSATEPPWERGSSSRQKAAWESGQDDLPSWDDARWVEETETLDLDCVDLNSYLALDYECLAQVAGLLGDDRKAQYYRERYASLVARMNELLWSEERGVYLDRRWDGTWSSRLTATAFLPLVAGVPSPERAARMLETLLDATKFWGPYVVPTVSRDDPAYREQRYWRGSIWPPMNYLIYQGLRRYGFDVPAADLAAKSVELFLAAWRTSRLCPEYFNSVTGQPEGHRHHGWGTLLPLIGLEEFIDVTPWDGVRIGTAAPPHHSTLHRAAAAGHRWTIALGPDWSVVECDGTALVAADGPLVLRHVTIHDAGFSAEASASRPVTFRAYPDRDAVPSVEVNGAVLRGAARLPSGRHALRVVLPAER